MGDVRLADLSLEDYEKVMAEAREKVEAESSLAASIALFKAKKKDLITDIAYGVAEDVYRRQKCMSLSAPLDACSEFIYFRNNVYQKFMNFVNYCMKTYMIGPSSKNAPYIDNANDYHYFELLCEEVGEVMKRWMLGDGMSHDQLEKFMEGEEQNGH